MLSIDVPPLISGIIHVSCLNHAQQAFASAHGRPVVAVYDYLFRACIENKVEAYGFVREGLPVEGDLKVLLRQYGKQFLQLIFDEEVLSMYRVVIGESAVHSKIAELFFETGPGRTIEAYARFMEARMNAGCLKRDDPRYTAVVYLNMMRGHYHMQLLMSMKIELSEKTLDRHIEKAVNQFLELYGV